MGTTMPAAVKYLALVVGAVLWLSGLSDQLHSLTETMKYLVISLAMVALALL